jgi:hypothetical protein
MKRGTHHVIHGRRGSSLRAFLANSFVVAIAVGLAYARGKHVSSASHTRSSAAPNMLHAPSAPEAGASTRVRVSRRRLAASWIFLVLTGLAAFASWKLFEEAGTTPTSPIAEPYRLSGIGVLVDRPGMHATVILNCITGAGMVDDRWCAVALEFPSSTPAGTRWAMTFGKGLRPEGHGPALFGQETVHGQRVFQDFPGERFPLGVTTTYYYSAGSLHPGDPSRPPPRPHPTITYGAAAAAAGGMVITGYLTAHRVITQWHRGNEEPYFGEIPLERTERTVAFGVHLPVPAEREENGLVAGALPDLGLVGTGYFLVGGPVGDWQAPAAHYFASGSNLAIENQLLGSLQSAPPPDEPRKLQWEQKLPFQAKWLYTQPSQASSARLTTFLSGVLLSLAGGLLVAFIQTLVLTGSQTRAQRADELHV